MDLRKKSRREERKARAWRFNLILLGILAVASGLRFWQIATKPGYDWDESVYQVIGANMADHNMVQAKTEAGFAPEPYLYHPPFYYMLLGAWFRVFGNGVPQSRELAAVGSLFMLVVIAYWLKRIVGTTWALSATALLAIDGWMVFTNRVGWFENIMMPLGILGLWLYGNALKRPSFVQFALAGSALGAVTVFKHVGIYFLIAVLVNWVVVRQKHRLHIALFGVAGLMMGIYVGIMSLVYGTTYWSASTVQIQRILGMRESRGSVNSLSDIITPLVAQYRIFFVTLLLVAITSVLVLLRTWQMIRRRTTAVLGDNTLLFSWASAALLCFGIMRLWLPHYFLMIIVPIYCYLAREMQLWSEARAKPVKCRHGRKRKSKLLIAAIAVILAANATAYWVRIVSGTDNALKATAIWMHNNVPEDSIVVTEESIGAVIEQPYCKIAHAGACHGATYIVTYNSHTQQPPRLRSVNEMLATATKLKTFRGFKEDITILRLEKPVK